MLQLPGRAIEDGMLVYGAVLEPHVMALEKPQEPGWIEPTMPQPTPQEKKAPHKVEAGVAFSVASHDFRNFRSQRSEERRVGKECRSRWWPVQSNKKKNKNKFVTKQIEWNTST